MMTRAWLGIRRLCLQLTADRRRFGIFCGLLAVALLFWTRLIVIQDMPRVAMAEPDLQVEEASENNPAEPGTMITRVVHVTEGPIRNPFRINPTFYPPVIEKSESIREGSKLSVQPTDKTRSALEACRLEAVMGTVAVVSGQTCRVGSRLKDTTGGGLRIELAEVRERSVVIRCGDVRHVLYLD